MYAEYGDLQWPEGFLQSASFVLVARRVRAAARSIGNDEDAVRIALEVEGGGWRGTEGFKFAEVWRGEVCCVRRAESVVFVEDEGANRGRGGFGFVGCCGGCRDKVRSELLGEVEKGRDGEIREEMRWVAQEGLDREIEGGEVGVEKGHFLYFSSVPVQWCLDS